MRSARGDAFFERRVSFGFSVGNDAPYSVRSYCLADAGKPNFGREYLGLPGGIALFGWNAALPLPRGYVTLFRRGLWQFTFRCARGGIRGALW